MTPCSFIRGNISEEIPAFVFNMKNYLLFLKMQAAVSSGILVKIYKNTQCRIPEYYVNVNRSICFASRNAYLLF